MSVDLGALKIIDGGMGMYAAIQCAQQIDGHPLWSGRLAREEPDLVKKIHTEFLDAGADIIETISYQLSVEKIREVYGVSIDEAESCLADTVHLAKEAVEEAWPRLRSQGRVKPLVAACIGPYGAVLCNMSEYSGDYVDSVSTDFLKAWHRPRIAAMLRADPDLLTIDTIPAVGEAKAIVEVLREFPNVPAWISFSTVDGARTCHGDSLEEAGRITSGIQAVGVNCCPTSVVSPALRHLRKGRGNKLMVVQPNSGDKFNPVNKTFSADPNSPRIVDCMEEWVSLGCRWIGGCCGCKPSDIAELAAKMKKIKKEEFS